GGANGFGCRTHGRGAHRHRACRRRGGLAAVRTRRIRPGTRAVRAERACAGRWCSRLPPHVAAGRRPGGRRHLDTRAGPRRPRRRERSAPRAASARRPVARHGGRLGQSVGSRDLAAAALSAVPHGRQGDGRLVVRTAGRRATRRSRRVPDAAGCSGGGLRVELLAGDAGSFRTDAAVDGGHRHGRVRTVCAGCRAALAGGGPRVRRVAALAIAVTLTWAVVGPLQQQGGHSAALALGIALLAAAIVGWLCEFVRLPRITGYLAVGLVCGPAVANLITEAMARDLQAASRFAVVVIAVMAGLHIDLRVLRPHLGQVTRLASITLAVAWLVFAAAFWAVWPWLPIAADLVGVQRLVAAALAATLLIS